MLLIVTVATSGIEPTPMLGSGLQFIVSLERMAFNVLWSLLFFVCRSPLLGMIDIVILDILVILYIAWSARVRAGAALLFVPYLCWILFATYLNAYILAANGTGL